jgi:hypothetical protein
MKLKVPHPFCAKIAWPELGSRETIEVKIRIDMPLPTPRVVISSPSHMINAVPAVSETMMSPTRAGPKWGIRSTDWPFVVRIVPLWNRNANPADCMIASATVR